MAGITYRSVHYSSCLQLAWTLEVVSKFFRVLEIMSQNLDESHESQGLRVHLGSQVPICNSRLLLLSTDI